MADRPTTQPRLAAIPNERPAENGATETPVLDHQALLLVEEILKKRGIPPHLSPDAQDLIEKAAKVVPKWVIYAFITFIVPSLGAFYTTAQAVWGLPGEVAALKTQVTEQGKQLEEIKALLTNRPTSTPKP